LLKIRERNMATRRRRQAMLERRKVLGYGSSLLFDLPNTPDLTTRKRRVCLVEE
jgi:hypothetical protein